MQAMASRTSVIVVIATTVLSAASAAEEALVADAKINELLEPIRQKYQLPAMAGAIVTSNGLSAIGAVGVRKAGTEVEVTVDDQWHLGSDTKALTATLIAVLVERGKLRWESTIEQVFPDLAESLPAKIRTVTLIELLSHRAGLPHDLTWLKYMIYGSVRKQRQAVVEDLASVKLLADPGAKYEYSNVGYVVAAAMAEKVADDSWENLISQIVFQPLKMKSTGFGGLGESGKVDQPWGHAGGVPFPFHGRWVDNLPVMGPAATVHCTLADWSEFIADQLRGARGEKALLKRSTYEVLHRPAFDQDYALGWIAVNRKWADGMALMHGGSNGLYVAVVWMAPKKDLAALVCANEGDEEAAKACHAAAEELLKLRLQ